MGASACFDCSGGGQGGVSGVGMVGKEGVDGGFYCMRSGGRAWCFVRNSASSRVKMSLVTAAMLYSSRRARQRASIRAVLPEPTGLVRCLLAGLPVTYPVAQCSSCAIGSRETTEESLPTDAHRECSLVPVAAGYQWHFSLGVGAWSVEYLVRVAMFGGVEFVGVGMGAYAIVAVSGCCRHLNDCNARSECLWKGVQVVRGGG